MTAVNETFIYQLLSNIHSMDFLFIELNGAKKKSSIPVQWKTPVALFQKLQQRSNPRNRSPYRLQILNGPPYLQEP